MRARKLACGCITHGNDTTPDAAVHVQKEWEALRLITEPPATQTSESIACALSWFYDHDDSRGIEHIRFLPTEERREILAGLRSLMDFLVMGVEHGPAVSGMFIALGLGKGRRGQVNRL